jgi:hypothetical protein
MGYVDYNESLYRTGFRPMGETDPFGASHGLHGIFGPERLHGVFNPSGGQRLHGLGDLGDIVPDQSIVVYTGTWRPHGTQGATDVIGQASALLAQEGLAVRSASSSAYRFLVNNTFNVKLTIQVANGMGYGDPSDIASIVDNAAYVATGSMPLASSISSVQVPGGSPPVPTGQPEIPDTGSGSGQQPAQPIDFTTWLEANAMWIGLGIAGLVVLPRLLNR